MPTMANNEHDDDDKRARDQLDEIIRRERVGLDAAEEWSTVASRIADALEHQTMGMLIMQLTSLGGKPELKNVKHREECPACVLTRQIVNQIQRASLIAKPNGRG
jgi:hypothetical protein